MNIMPTGEPPETQHADIFKNQNKNKLLNYAMAQLSYQNRIRCGMQLCSFLVCYYLLKRSDLEQNNHITTKQQPRTLYCIARDVHISIFLSFRLFLFQGGDMNDYKQAV